MRFNNRTDVYKTTSLKFSDINDMQNILQKVLMRTGIAALLAFNLQLHLSHSSICNIILCINITNSLHPVFSVLTCHISVI